MKKYGDTVLFRRGAATVNALVLQSSIQKDGEHLTIVYLDPSFASPILSGSAAQQAIATAFTVPLKEGQVQGWIDAETLSEQAILQMQANFGDTQLKDDSRWEKEVEDLKAQLATAMYPGGGPPPTPPHTATLTDDEVYAHVKVGLEEKGEVPHVEGALLSQVLDAVNRFLKEKAAETPAEEPKQQ